MEYMVFKSRRTAEVEAKQIQKFARMVINSSAIFTVELAPLGGYYIRVNDPNKYNYSGILPRCVFEEMEG